MKKTQQLFYWLLSFSTLLLIHCQSEAPPPQVQEVNSSLPVPATKPYLSFRLQEGDLLFQDSDCGGFCQAIEKVTHGVKGAKFSHVGMITRNANRQMVVLEAISAGVVETPLDTFFNRSFDIKGQPKIIVGRLKKDYQNLIPDAIKFAQNRLGKPYDEYFDLNNDAYYCSELLYFAFKEANAGQPIFQLRPMTFKDPDTGQYFPVWVDYYQARKKLIPENEPGLNPGSMSRSIYLDIVHVFGQPEGFRE